MGIMANASIIPFASGNPIEMESAPSGISTFASVVSFGNFGFGTFIDANTVFTVNTNQSFIMPTDGVITSFSAFFSPTIIEFDLNVDITVWAQLFIAPPDTTDSREFTAIPGSIINLGTFTDSFPSNSVNTGVVSDLNFPISEESRLMVVFYSTSTQGALGPRIRGYASAGVSIV